MESITFENYARKIPIHYTPEVVVFGGGIAGVVAACSAALHGKKTLLIEQSNALGGMGTIGGVSGFCGETSGQGKIFDEIIQELEKYDAIKPYFPAKRAGFKGRLYKIEFLKYILQKIVLNYEVKLLFHTRLIDAVFDPNSQQIQYAIIHGKSGLEGVRAKYYFDCTGEADIVRMCGGKIIKGSPNNPAQLPMAFNFLMDQRSKFNKISRIPTKEFVDLSFRSKKQLPMVSFYPGGQHSKIVKVKLPGFDATSTEQLSEAEIKARDRMIRIMHFYQDHEKKHWEPLFSFPTIGIREGCRIIGEYYLTLADLRKGQNFQDGIAVGTYLLDAHKPDDDFRTYILPKDQLKIPPYHIPLRALIPQGMKNVLVAGRNLSADQLTLSSARVMTTCAMMGHAIGGVAYLCQKNSKTPLEIALNYSQDLQSLLKLDKLRLDLEYYQ